MPVHTGGHIFEHFINTRSSSFNVVANRYISPPSFNFSFFRNSVTEAGKLRTVRFAFSTPPNKVFNSFFPNPETAST